MPRPHAGYSPTAPLLAPRAPPPPPAPASCSDPGHPGPCVASATALGWGLLLPNRPRTAPCPDTFGRAWGPTGTSWLHSTGMVPGWPQAAAAAVGHGVAAVPVQAAPSRLRSPAPPCCRGTLGSRQPSKAPTNPPWYTRETTGQGKMTPLLLPPQTKSCWQCRGKEQGQAVPSTRPSSHLCLGRAGSLPISQLLPAPPQPLAWLWRPKGLL